MAKKLTRSREQRVIAGVCGGMADFFQVDVTVVRLLWLIAAFFGGSGLIAYLVALIIIPEEPFAGEGNETIDLSKEGAEGSNPTRGEEHKDESRKILGLILVGLGILFALHNFFPWFSLHRLWPLIFVVLGVLILFSGKRGR